MSQSLESGPVVKTETGVPTEEYRKASRAGRVAFGGVVAMAIVAAIAAFAGSYAVALTCAGLAVALFVVALLLHFEGVRQRLRPDSRRPRKSTR